MMEWYFWKRNGQREPFLRLSLSHNYSGVLKGAQLGAVHLLGKADMANVVEKKYFFFRRRAFAVGGILCGVAAAAPAPREEMGRENPRLEQNAPDGDFIPEDSAAILMWMIIGRLKRKRLDAAFCGKAKPARRRHSEPGGDGECLRRKSRRPYLCTRLLRC